MSWNQGYFTTTYSRYPIIMVKPNSLAGGVSMEERTLALTESNVATHARVVGMVATETAARRSRRDLAGRRMLFLCDWVGRRTGRALLTAE